MKSPMIERPKHRVQFLTRLMRLPQGHTRISIGSGVREIATVDEHPDRAVDGSEIHPARHRSTDPWRNASLLVSNALVNRVRHGLSVNSFGCPFHHSDFIVGAPFPGRIQHSLLPFKRRLLLDETEQQFLAGSVAGKAGRYLAP